MNNQHSSLIKFFVLGDSHARHFCPPVSTSSYSLIKRSISGLKWIDDRNETLSLYALLSSPEIRPILKQANAVLFLIGTNSVRIIPARKIISQVQEIILSIQKNYPHLNQPKTISISLTFPCLKPITHGRFPTNSSLLSNINLYNEKLILLSSQLNFNIIDFNITENHLRNDNMHIESCFQHLVFNSIINHFDGLIETTSLRTTTNSNPPLPLPPTSTLTTISTLTSTSDKEKKSQSSQRTQESLSRRNKQRYDKLKLKQQQHKIKRKIHHQWIASQIKQYLDSHNIRYARVTPIYKSILLVQFNNEEDRDLADSQITTDIFNENHYKEFINSQPS